MIGNNSAQCEKNILGLHFEWSIVQTWVVTNFWWFLYILYYANCLFKLNSYIKSLYWWYWMCMCMVNSLFSRAPSKNILELTSFWINNFRKLVNYPWWGHIHVHKIHTFLFCYATGRQNMLSPFSLTISVLFCILKNTDVIIFYRIWSRNAL